MKDTKKQKASEEIIKGKSMSRKDAMKRLGLSAFSAATMMLLLNNPAKAQDGDSPELPPPWP